MLAEKRALRQKLGNYLFWGLCSVCNSRKNAVVLPVCTTAFQMKAVGLAGFEKRLSVF